MPTDQELVRKALSGQPAAAEELLLRHTPVLLSEAREAVWRLVDGEIEAEDIMQSFYERICRNSFRALALWHGLTAPNQESIEPYFKSILSNLVFDHVRPVLARRIRELHIDGEEPVDTEDPSGDFVDDIDHQQKLAAMWNCIETALNDRQRRIVRLFLEGRSHADIARLLGIQEGNSRVALHRALGALQRCIESRV
jgi:RNA polymerase sigma-70 factor (ECF subfamily)